MKGKGQRIRLGVCYLKKPFSFHLYSFACIYILACLLVLVLFGPARASNPPVKSLHIDQLLTMSLEELINVEITLATGSAKSMRLAPAVASVITAADIQRLGATTLDEILETVPGVHVEPSTVNIFSSVWSIRGINTTVNPQVLLLINGIPMTPASTGSRLHSFRLPVAMISRVEVVRGPGSAMHGADAFSGTVNVITKEAVEINGTETGVRYGSFNTLDAWLQHGGQYKGWDVLGAFEVQKSDGDDSRIVGISRSNLAAQTNNPKIMDSTYNLFTTHLGVRRDKFALRLFGELHYDNGLEDAGFQTVTRGSRVDGRELLADLTYRDKEFARDWDLGLRFYWAYMETDNFFEFFQPGVATYWLGNPIAIDRITGLEATTFYKGFKDHLLRISAGWKYCNTDTDQYKNFGLGTGVPMPGFGPLVNIKNTAGVYMEDHGRRIWNFSLQDEWTFLPRWTLTGGVRYDHYNDFGPTTNPRGGLVWEMRPDLTSKLLYGRAFRAPSFAEMYNQNTPSITGNPGLDPETIDTYELALDYQPAGRLSTRVNLFFYEIDGLIEYINDPAPANTSTARNSKDQEGHGFEVEADWQVRDDLLLRASFAYQRSWDTVTKEVVPFAPAMQLYLNPHWQFRPDWSLAGQFFWIAARHRQRGDPRQDIADYTQTNVILRHQAARAWDLALGVNNLFDRDIRIPSAYAAAAPTGAWIPGDYPMEGRSVWLEARVHY